MDEIGRGTSTFDGLSLAWATARHLALRVGAFTLFATHYFELTALAAQLPGVLNVHLDAAEHRHGIVFMHAVKPGPANKSYGLAVAKLAGLPREVLTDARRHLVALEERAARTGTEAEAGGQGALALHPADEGAGSDRSATDDVTSGGLSPSVGDASVAAVLEALRAVDPDTLTPREALERLYDLKKLCLQI
jgi:DNA mismatch repair protein MutS